MTDRAAEWYRQSMLGVTYEVIAHHAGVSKNTVAGAIWRHRQANGLPGFREDQRQRADRLPKSQVPIIDRPCNKNKTYASPKAIASPLDTVKATVTSFADVVEHNTCRYIGGGIKGPDTYCGNHRAKGSDYCHGCHAVVYRRGSTVRVNQEEAA